VLEIKNLLIFENFLKLCAGRTGQILNYNSLADDCGIDAKTVKKWLTVLEAGYIINRLPPYYKNLNKRLIKQPKLYFYDTGLVCYLLGIHSPDHLAAHPLYGAIFETYVMGELWKKGYNSIVSPSLYFFRDSRGREVDVVIEKSQEIDQIEIKAGQTISSHFFKGLKYLKELTQVDQSYLIYTGKDSYKREGINILNSFECDTILEK
jgi:predicted AAA+ superfamily ATPase